ncbi:hypothetical protein BD413DRAFT_516269 [Trametes elegans]|nr:hypothetical protein BD413DRAFT_516269 [Trametes elegans]
MDLFRITRMGEFGVWRVAARERLQFEAPRRSRERQGTRVGRGRLRQDMRDRTIESAKSRRAGCGLGRGINNRGNHPPRTKQEDGRARIG